MTNATKVADDIFMVPWDQGNGVIRREIWIGQDGKASRYHLAYINQEMCTADDGRVLGFDYINGQVNAYSMGEIENSTFSTLEELEERFDVKWDFLPKPNTPPSGLGEQSAGVIGADDGGEYPETKGMKLTITKGGSADFFKRGRELASKLDRGERPEPEKVIMFGSRADLCYSQMPKGEWASLRGKLLTGKSTTFE
ncbi:MAG: hypothetical protein HXX11_11350 [Desulfuromonadales bacterium]|nr:hypothetical protein [Desulfuromonadales bacterium]